MRGFNLWATVSVPFCLLGFAFEAGAAADDWKSVWEATRQAAKKEGRLVLYTFPGQEQFFEEFRRKFPDINLVEVTVRGSERILRIKAERRAGKYLADLLIGGASSVYTGLFKAGMLDPVKPALLLPEVLDPKPWWGGKHPYADEEGQYILGFLGSPVNYFHYNTRLVDPKEFRSYWDFINPKWKGKILVAEPMSGGTAEILQFLYHHPGVGPDFLRRFLTEMDLTVTRDVRQYSDWLAQGKFPIAGLQNADRVQIGEARKQGLDVASFDFGKFKEGIVIGSGGGNITLINRAPHPNAAKVFINWLLSREGQSAYQKLVIGGRNSLRTDIPKDDVPEDSRIPQGVKYTVISDAAYADIDSVEKFVNQIWRRRR